MVALNVGPDFKQRWLDAPEAVRQTFMDDLNHICDLLQPNTQTQLWLAADQKAQDQAQQIIEQAYADLKARLIEEARIRRQLALEKSLAEKRAATALYAQQLWEDEGRQFAEQTQTLAHLRQQIEQALPEQRYRLLRICRVYTPQEDQAADQSKIDLAPPTPDSLFKQLWSKMGYQPDASVERDFMQLLIEAQHSLEQEQP